MAINVKEQTPSNPPHPLCPPLLLDVTEGNNSGGRIPA